MCLMYIKTVNVQYVYCIISTLKYRTILRWCWNCGYDSKELTSQHWIWRAIERFIVSLSRGAQHLTIHQTTGHHNAWSYNQERLLHNTSHKSKCHVTSMLTPMRNILGPKHATKEQMAVCITSLPWERVPRGERGYLGSIHHPNKEQNDSNSYRTSSIRDCNYALYTFPRSKWQITPSSYFGSMYLGS